MQKKVQFVTDAEGHKTAIILPIEEYEEVMEDLEMGRAARESKAQRHLAHALDGVVFPAVQE
jgi:PHD/YefM family antitoxin component YafN of YafNO toxin-antitoxin module